ncbi:Alpha/beta hydrolase family-domain-containing protein [Stachybotrys elegans]|uniref:Alpha/beta hydrolase family-domain-containing protein n=1 Tax=Stachybotrys elegans TaxID=80388 RepID=A0A8K0STN3_9HYPO|nr:Alpha/beta hydrolase family-domain-containing protein [Stachybotrys elegans]
MPLPTLVFIPGSWHKPTCYDKIAKLLQEKHQLKCVYVSLPSTTGNRAATFKDDLEAARDAISGEIAAGLDVVVIAHSYGGMVGNSAVKGLGRPSEVAPSDSNAEESSTTGHVIGLILIASGFTATGLAFMDPFMGRPPPSWRVNTETGFAELVVSPRQFFYHDVPSEEANYWVSQLTPQSLKSLFEGGEFTYSGWLDVPAWYIGTVEDQGLPVVVQRIQVGMARAMGASVEHRELPTSHSPFLSRPEETVSIIVDATEAFSGIPVQMDARSRGLHSDIVVPAARIWPPSTWYKFGVPLVLGHVIGQCISLRRIKY